MPPKLRAIAAALALTVTACSGGGDADEDDAETSAAEFEKPTVALHVERADLVSPHQARGPLDDDTADAVVDVVQRLLLVTSAEPLTSGEAGAGFADLFTPDAGERAANADRGVFFDEGVPTFGTLQPDLATIAMTGLAGTMDPSTQLVIATFRWDVGGSDRPDDRIVREGQLSLIPEDSEWKIGAYTIVVTRTIDDSTTTTTATTDDDAEEDE